MRSILIGLDGSEDSLPAIDLGIDWGKRFKSLIVGVGIVDEPAIRGTQPGGKISRSYQPAYAQLLRESRHGVEQSLERFAIRCSEQQVPFKLLEDEGQPCDEILKELQRYDLLILGGKTHFRHNSEQRPCHTLEQVVRTASRPVVVVPPKTIAERGNAIVIAYDGSAQASRALQAFQCSGVAEGSRVQILSVHSDSKVEAARIADRAAEFLHFHAIQAECVAAVGDNASRLILNQAEEVDAELIVMGAYGQSPVTEFFFGSVTSSVLRKTSTPLFLFH